MTLPKVDPNRIASLGICVGGSYALCNAQTELRVKAVARTVNTYWANFARTGDPNGPGLPKWPPCTCRKQVFVGTPTSRCQI